MKKYLMTGVAALAICAAFTSCSKSEELYDQGVVDGQKVASFEEQYAAAFTKFIGGPVGANVDWGFGSRAMTRGSQPNRNEWGKAGTVYADVVVPEDVTKKEALFVMNWFATHTKADGTTLDLNDYFVQQVGYGGHSYPYEGVYYETKENGVWKTRTDRGSVAANNHMDHLYSNLDGNSQKYDHLYNFNTNSGDIMLMWGSETQYGFGFDESYGTDQKHVYENYLLAQITVPADCFADGKARTGYYVGFDYETLKMATAQYGWAQKSDGSWGPEEEFEYEYIHILPDGVYDDRVVKIVPAKEKKIDETPTYRVIAEDLSAQGDTDFDFNDVVFDVEPNEAGTAAKLVLQACGGIYRLEVDGVEVHGLYGYSADEEGLFPMINTGDGPSNLGTRIIRESYAGNFSTDANIRATIKNITIKVWKPTSKDSKDVVECTLSANYGKPASKVLVDKSFGIVPEHHSIANEHGLFTSYARGEWQEGDNFWWKK